VSAVALVITAVQLPLQLSIFWFDKQLKVVSAVAQVITAVQLPLQLSIQSCVSSCTADNGSTTAAATIYSKLCQQLHY